MEVFAVRGRSAVACDTTAPEVAGIFPPNSMRLILVFSSSSSSQTEVAGPVEPWDSVSSARGTGSCGVSTWATCELSREDE